MTPETARPCHLKHWQSPIASGILLVRLEVAKDEEAFEWHRDVDSRQEA